MNYLPAFVSARVTGGGVDSELTIPLIISIHSLSQVGPPLLPGLSTEAKSLHRRMAGPWLYGASEPGTRWYHLPSTAFVVPILNSCLPQLDTNQVTPKGTPSPELQSLHSRGGGVRRVGSPENDCNRWGWEAPRMGGGYGGRSEARTSKGF